MAILFIFLSFINFVSCVNNDEENPHKQSGSDAYYAPNNYLDFDYEHSQASHQNGGEPSLFDSRLNRSNRFTDLDHFLFHDQDTKLDQSINHFNYMIPDLTTFEKDQELQLQAPINDFHPTLTLTLSNQQSSMNQASFRPIILPQNPSNSAQNALISNLQPFSISSDRIQEFPTKRRIYIPWKAYELNNLLKGVNEYGEHWKEILNSYKFEERRTNVYLHHKFYGLKKRGKIIQTKEGGWKFVSRGKLTDLMRGEGEGEGEGEDEHIQKEKGSQEDAELVNNKSGNRLSSLDQDKVSRVIENLDQEQDQKDLFLVKKDGKRHQTSWKHHEFINLIKGINKYGKNWKKIHESFKFEQGRIPAHLSSRFFILRRNGQVTFINGFGWKFINENKPRKAAGSQRQVQEQKRPFFVRKAKKSGKHHYLSWKKCEQDKLLEGVNKYGRSWKKIFAFYKFEGRTSSQLAAQFKRMEDGGRIIYEKDFGWKYTDSYEEKIRDKVVF